MTFRDKRFVQEETDSNHQQDKCVQPNANLADDLSGSENRSLESAIVNFLQSRRGPFTEKQLFENIKGRRQRKIAALRSLISGSNSPIERLGTGEKGDPYLYAIQNVEAKSSVSVSNEIVNSLVFKRYMLPDGSFLELSQSDFDDWVDLTRMLSEQAQKMKFFTPELPKENEPLEPIKDGVNERTLVIRGGK